MRRSHPDTELIAYLNDEVRGAARERIRGHLEACAECQDALEAYRRLLDDLRRSIPAPPALHSARYRAELRAKLAERREHARRWWQPASMALSAGLAACPWPVGVPPHIHQVKSVTENGNAGLAHVADELL